MKNTLITSNLEFGCKLINEAINIPVYVINEHGDCIVKFSSNEGVNPLFRSTEEFLMGLPIPKPNHLTPIIHTTNFLEKLVFIPYTDESNSGTIFLGPTVYPKPTKIAIQEITTNQNFKNKQLEFEDYYNSLPVISSWKLIHASIMLVYFLYNKKLDINEVIKNNLEKVELLEFDPNKSIVELRQNSSYHHDPLREKMVYQYITEGKKDELLLHWRSFQESNEFKRGVLSKKSELRNQKNHTIATITIATRAAIAGGLHSEIAYTIGDTQIQELEELHNIKDVRVFKENCVYEFAERVAKSKKQKYSKPISDCQYYIFKHLYEEISLSILADYVSKNPKYLSNLFKKEVGISVTDYIQRTKVDEAIRLMIFSNKSLTEIHALLNFTDQSYFTKVFKKHTGFTPKQYLKNIESVNKEKSTL